MTEAPVKESPVVSSIVTFTRTAWAEMNQKNKPKRKEERNNMTTSEVADF